VKPEKAQVYLDGYYVGLVDQFDGTFQRLDLPPGEHEITVYDQGYRTFRQKTLFRPGQSYHFKAILEPLAAGTAQDPVPTPTGPDPYSPDRYRDRDRGPGSQDPNQNYPQGDSGRTQPLPERQPHGENRMEVGGFGTLNIRVQPGDAAVTVDGERWDSPEGGSRLSLQLATGTHRIEVQKSGFKPYSATIQLRAGETQSLNISLPPGGVL
jgi:PEGA domain-containing protein